jgi:hypothetical protein
MFRVIIRSNLHITLIYCMIATIVVIISIVPIIFKKIVTLNNLFFVI